MLEVFLKEEIFQLTNTLVQRWLPFLFLFFFSPHVTKWKWNHGFISCVCCHLYGFRSIEADEILWHRQRQKKKTTTTKKSICFWDIFHGSRAIFLMWPHAFPTVERWKCLLHWRKPMTPGLCASFFFFFFLDAYLLFGDRQQLLVTAPASPRIRLT